MIAEVFSPFRSVCNRCIFGCKHVWLRLSQSGTTRHCNSFLQSSLQNSSSSVKLLRDQTWTQLFKSSYKFSIGLRSGYSRTFTLFSLNHFCVAFAVCFGSLSCWKRNLLQSRTSLSEWIRLSSRIWWYLFCIPVPLYLYKHPRAWRCHHHASLVNWWIWVFVVRQT